MLLSHLVRKHLQTNIHINIRPNIWLHSPAKLTQKMNHHSLQGQRLGCLLWEIVAHRQFHLIDSGFTWPSTASCQGNQQHEPSAPPQLLATESNSELSAIRKACPQDTRSSSHRWVQTSEHHSQPEPQRANTSELPPGSERSQCWSHSCLIRTEVQKWGLGQPRV